MRVAQSVAYFMQAVASRGLANNVLLFTASDFGRTLGSNGDGSDHGWGSHQVVVGGDVKGRHILGGFLTTALSTADDIGSSRLLPGTSVTPMAAETAAETAAEVAGWMGLSATELLYVLPDVGNFMTGELDVVEPLAAPWASPASAKRRALTKRRGAPLSGSVNATSRASSCSGCA